MRLTTFCLFALFSGACTEASVSERTQAITGGAPDDQDSSVVFVTITQGGTTGYCSGTVISPHVVLTAAHCTLAPAGAKFSLFLGADYHDAAAMAAPENHVDVTEAIAHPDFSRNVLVSSDVGVLITATPIPRPAIPLNRVPLEDGDVGRSVRIVGYGQTEGSDGGYPPLSTIGRRNSATTTIDAVDPEAFTIKGLPNTCLVDSGGPTFMAQDGVDVLVGVHSIGDSYACDSQGTDARVDDYLDFIDQHIQAADATPDMATVDAAGPAPAPSSGCDVGGTHPSGMCFVLGLMLALGLRRRLAA